MKDATPAGASPVSIRVSAWENGYTMTPPHPRHPTRQTIKIIILSIGIDFPVSPQAPITAIQNQQDKTETQPVR